MGRGVGRRLSGFVMRSMGGVEGLDLLTLKQTECR
jgi:hypothetical protein